MPEYQNLLERLQTLWSQGKSDEMIAKQLTQEGFHSVRSTQVSKATVKGLRLEHGWRNSSRNKIVFPDGYWSVVELATLLSVSPQWVYSRIRNQQIAPEYVMRLGNRRSVLIRHDSELLEHLHQLR